jgi:prokaryotic ubiquitin-like protein Pup
VTTQDHGGQQRGTRRPAESETEQAPDTSDVQERQEKLTEDVDDILDDIDAVLESNAEDFVASFVQKGGQ